MISRVILLLIFGASQVFISCNSKTEPDAPPNIVWITSEDNSKHYMSLFDNNGAPTPNIERLAKNGVIYTRAFSNAPVCSAARSTLISASYGPRLASHYHRKLEKVPMPEGLRMFPYYLRKLGYHTSNNAKEDYNIITSDSVWDMSSKKASWRERKEGQPFFHVFNIGTTHESRLHFTKEDMAAGTISNPDSMFVQPNHPQTDLFRYTNARYHDKIKEMDIEVGQVIDELEKDGLLENTFIFYFGDHGGVLPGSKAYINEMGVHVPLVVYIPPKYQALVDEKPGSENEGFVSFIDFGPTVLHLAGAEIPKGIDGTPFLGKTILSEDVAKRDETFSYADRFDEKYDMVRALRKGKYKYERHYQPFNYDGLMNNYRFKQLGYQEWKQFHSEGKLNDIQSQFFKKKKPESLYDVELDPYQTKDLSSDPKYAAILKDMRNNLNNRITGMPDLSFYPEFYLLEEAFGNPVVFGQTHKADIARYLDIANLSLFNFEDIASKIEHSLKAEDPWERYWALITCSNFGEIAEVFEDTIRTMSQSDSELINRVRASEFLGLTGAQDPSGVMTKALYDSYDPAEALLIMNSMVLMKDAPYHYNFNLDIEILNPKVREDIQVKRRLEYLMN